MTSSFFAVLSRGYPTPCPSLHFVLGLQFPQEREGRGSQAGSVSVSTSSPALQAGWNRTLLSLALTCSLATRQ